MQDQNRPWLTHKRKLPLRPDEIVPVDIEIIATSTQFLPGQALRITIQGTDIFRDEKVVQTMLHENTVNQGKHVIWCGGPFESALVMPLIDP